ncbi:two-component system sensor histidine kinase CreC [Erwinia persicina]|uniref:two-component system sensor histidine kinase CreC n=1 Tax=Erwinia persicina TaxID=55211 RepID=UPI0016548046|nr:two-component system sensor histidine kinase CreC [Erwinia persicina]MBC3945271.1 two-component system sensor histidine kinase CreC [Erwinia persicina]
MRIGMRLLLGYFLIVAVAAWFVLSIFLKEVKPGVRRATEGTLVDTATLLAQFARADILSGQPQNGQLAAAFSQLRGYPVRADISGIAKRRNEYRVYLTDEKGRVLFDSAGVALGQDYSRWNDVLLTLRGEYGARSSRSNPDDDASSVMYVAAPVRDGARLLGVLSVGKANSTMVPVIRRSERRILWAGAALLGIALLIGLTFVLWINRSVGRLVRYADSVTQGEALPLPAMNSSELRKLAQALESMRLKLEGKRYIEHYAHALTHELKSPLAAIRGAAEILHECPPAAVVQRFSANILQQNIRMQRLIDNLLRQATLENRPEIQRQTVSLLPLVTGLCDSRAVQAQGKRLTFDAEALVGLSVRADPLLLEQALANLLDNALDFTPLAGEVRIEVSQSTDEMIFQVQDSGSGIPDYALPHIFDRFYSLPRSNGEKSSGLGLAFVREVARLHQGSITLTPRAEGGVCAQLTIKNNV